MFAVIVGCFLLNLFISLTLLDAIKNVSQIEDIELDRKQPLTSAADKEKKICVCFTFQLVSRLHFVLFIGQLRCVLIATLHDFCNIIAFSIFTEEP